MNLRDLSKKFCSNNQIKCPICKSILDIDKSYKDHDCFDNEWFQCNRCNSLKDITLISDPDYVDFFIGYLNNKKYALYMSTEFCHIRYLELYSDSNEEILWSYLYLHDGCEDRLNIDSQYKIFDLSTEAPFFDIEKIKTLLLFQ